MVTQKISTTSLTDDTTGHPKCQDLAADSCQLLLILKSCQTLEGPLGNPSWGPLQRHCDLPVPCILFQGTAVMLTHTDHD